MHPLECAAVVAVGDELVQGDKQDRNVGWIATALAGHGWQVVEARLVGDDEAQVARTVLELGRELGLVVVTGGLGPTLDDVTRHALARAAGVGLRLDAEARVEVESWFRSRGRPIPASNERQMLLPEGAQMLRNPAGTAPGFRMRIAQAWVVVLPGPPFEMQAVFEREVAPWLATLPAHRELGLRAELGLFGLPESEFADRAGAWMEREANPCIGVLAHSGILCVRLTARAGAHEEARKLLEQRLVELRAAFAPWLFEEGGHDLAHSVGRRLIESRTSVATAESCTGGLVAEMLTRVPGISEVFLEGFVTYSNRAKVERLGVDPALIERHGAVSPEVAEAMARGAAERSGARLAVSVTGVAGPAGGTPEKPVGLVHFGLARDGRLRVESARFPPRGREQVREWAANFALDLLRRSLLSPP